MGHAVGVHLDDGEGRVADGLLLFENPDLRPLDEAAVVDVQAKMHQVFGKRRIRQVLITDGGRPCGHVQPRRKRKAVVLELDPGVFQGHVGAALHVGTALARIIDRLSVHRDAHEIQSEGIGSAHLASQRGDLHALVVVAEEQFIVDHLHLDFRRIGLDKTGVYHFVGLNITAAVELRLPFRQSHLLADGRHGTACTRHGQADVVSVHRGRTPVEALVGGIADKPEADAGPVADLVHDAPQMFGVPIGYDGFSVFKQDRVDAARRRIVDAGDGFGAEGVRAQLGLVGKILKRIVVPELHLHAPVQRAPPLRIVRGQGLRRPAALGLDGGVGQAQIILNGEGNAPGNRLGEPYGVAVDAFVPSLKRDVIRIADELDHEVLFAAEIFLRLPDLLQKFLRHAQHAFVVMKGGSQVLDARAMGVAVLIAQFDRRSRSGRP